ncbi:MAG: SufD family Fe-S cluster assembly protein [Solirubrobacterales bacterium]
MGQFERTLIIADEGSDVHYIGLHGPRLLDRLAALGGRRADRPPGARIRYTTVQNWSQNVYNLVTKRAIAERDATVESGSTAISAPR